MDTNTNSYVNVNEHNSKYYRLEYGKLLDFLVDTVALHIIVGCLYKPLNFYFLDTDN